MSSSKLPSRLAKLMAATAFAGMSASLALAAGTADPLASTPLDQAAFTISSNTDFTIRPDRTVRKTID